MSMKISVNHAKFPSLLELYVNPGRGKLVGQFYALLEFLEPTGNQMLKYRKLSISFFIIFFGSPHRLSPFKACCFQA